MIKMRSGSLGGKPLDSAILHLSTGLLLSDPKDWVLGQRSLSQTSLSSSGPFCVGQCAVINPPVGTLDLILRTNFPSGIQSNDRPHVYPLKNGDETCSSKKQKRICESPRGWWSAGLQRPSHHIFPSRPLLTHRGLRQYDSEAKKKKNKIKKEIQKMDLSTIAIYK